MKLSLTFLIILFLTLGAVACSGSPTAQKEGKSSVDEVEKTQKTGDQAAEAQKESGSSIDSNSALSKIALEVPTIT